MRHQIINNKAFLQISGADALQFLQGIMSADVHAEKATYALLLNPQGRYLSDFFISWIEGNSAILELPVANKDQILAKLRMYKLRSDISLEDVSDQYFVVFSDGKIEEAEVSYVDPRIDTATAVRKLSLREAVGDGAIPGDWKEYFLNLTKNSEIAASVGLQPNPSRNDKPLTIDGYFRSYLRKERLPKFLQNDSEFHDILKYSIPVIEGSEMIYEKSIPIEYGMEKFNAISFTKGCYVGQEVISRTKHTGIVRKKIYLAESKDNIKASQSDEILLNGEKKGKICSIWKNRAIVLMNDIISEDGVYEVNGQRLEIK